MKDSHHAGNHRNGRMGRGGTPTEHCSCAEDADELEPRCQMDGDGSIL